MFQKINSGKQLLLISFIFTALLFIATHGYRFVNTMYSGDSLLMIHQTDSGWQIALGRFVQPILVFLRGGIASPFLISVLSILWVSLSVYFMVDFLEIKKLISIFFVAAVMTCNSALLATNATFLPFMDFDTFALFLSVFGVWLLKKEKLPYLALGILALCISMGTYQAYICVSIGMVMLYFLFQLFELPSVKDTIKNLIKYLVSFALAAFIYFLVWKLFQKIFGIWTANSYNGLSSVGDYSDTSLLSIIGITYQKVFLYFVHPETFTTIPFRGISLSIVWKYILRICNIGLIAFSLLALTTTALKRKTFLWHRLAQAFILLVFPLGINFVCILSKGMTHTLMIYAFCLVYIMAVKIVDCYFPESGFAINLSPKYFAQFTALSLLFTICWSNLVYSNQVYLKKDLQEDAIHSLMTRIVYEIESTDGYIAGVTPVAISGSFEQTPALANMDAFSEILPYGMGNTSLTYIGTDYAYLTHILNVNMNLTRISREHEAVQKMPIYPAEGSVAFIDGILVVKVSE